MNFHNFGEKLFISVIDVVVEVEDTVGWAVGYQYVDVGGDFGDVFRLPIRNAVAHKHRHSVELHSVNFNTGVAEVMHI